VLGAEVSGSLRQEVTRFGLTRTVPGDAFRRSGWQMRGLAEQSSGDGPTLRSATLQLVERFSRPGWALTLEQQVGLLTGPVSLLRSDAFLLGGSRSLRGSYEGEFRAFRYLIDRLEIGPWLGPRGGRLYFLLDAGWLDHWNPSGSGLYGVIGERRFHWATGLGLQATSRAGLVTLEYAVPGGESLWSGRLHFGVGGVF
jgi:hypothetical protein